MHTFWIWQVLGLNMHNNKVGMSNNFPICFINGKWQIFYLWSRTKVDRIYLAIDLVLSFFLKNGITVSVNRQNPNIGKNMYSVAYWIVYCIAYCLLLSIVVYCIAYWEVEAQPELQLQLSRKHSQEAAGRTWRKHKPGSFNFLGNTNRLDTRNVQCCVLYVIYQLYIYVQQSV